MKALFFVICLYLSVFLAPFHLLAAGHSHNKITSYDGPKTCAACHPKAAKEFAVSLHYQAAAEPRYVEGWEKGKLAGMMIGLSTPANTSVAHNWLGILQPKDVSKSSQSGGCGMCHPGIGAKPNPSNQLTEADFDNIDCLLCHAPDYKRAVVKDGNGFKIIPAAGVDIVKAAQKVQRPTNEMCLRCHAGAGGGPNHKHGVIPTKESDIHMARGLTCLDCHTAREHRIAGGADLKAQELSDVRVACENCHKGTPHKGEKAPLLDSHSKRIACQTCHIPGIARDLKMPTVVERDWTKPILNEKTGLYTPANTFANNVKPEYRWWNRMMNMQPSPVGSINDGNAKIFPWKRTDYTDIADASSGKTIPIKAGVYYVTGDVDSAAKKGAEDTKQNYSGQWHGKKVTLYFSLNHQVASKSEALKCNACHDARGVLDFSSLGYTKEMTDRLTKTRQ